MKLVIGNKNYSSWSLRPWIFMRKFKLPFEEIRVPLFTEDSINKLRPYFSGNKVPVLIDGDRIIWDTLAILEYLSENYLNGKGWPDDPDKRAFARSVSAEMHSSFSTMRMQLPMNCRRKIDVYNISEEARKDIDRVMAIWGRCREKFSKSGEWLFGDYSIADAMYTPVVLRFNTYGVPLDEVGKDYMDKTLVQPELIEWMEASRQEVEIIEKSEL